MYEACRRLQIKLFFKEEDKVETLEIVNLTKNLKVNWRVVLTVFAKTSVKMCIQREVKTVNANYSVISVYFTVKQWDSIRSISLIRN